MAQQPRRLRDDPRLVDRRGDLRGCSALLFLLLLLGGVALIGAMLVAVVPAGVPATPTPRPGVATPRSTVLPGAVSQPSAASLTPAPSLPVAADQGEPATLYDGANVVGTATVTFTEFSPRLGGQRPPQGSRWLVATIEYDATAGLDYDASRWFAIDANGGRHPWHGAGDPAPALGSGTLGPGGTATGTVSFEVPARVKLTQMVMTDGADHDLLVVTLDQAG